MRMDEEGSDGGLGDDIAEPITAPPESSETSPDDHGFEIAAPVIDDAPASRRVALRAAVLLGIAGMLAGGLFFARSLVASGSGGTTPTAAAERLFDALAEEDAIGVLEAISPAERRLLKDPIQEVAKELSRLGILGESLNLANVDGLELEFFGLRFTEEKLAADISAVVVSDGRARSRFDPRGGLLGSFVTKLMGRDASTPQTATMDFAKDEMVVATVRDREEWYVSIGYSIAENVRRDSGSVAPTFGQGVAIGAATPEKAVEDLIRAAAGLEVSRLLQLAPPGEAGALHDYAQLFIPQLGSAAHDARGFFQAKITKLDLTSRATEPGVATVKVDRIGFVYEIPDFGMRIEYDGKCTIYRFEGEPPERDCGTGAGPALPFFLPLEELPTPDVGFVVVREGEEWFVSPTRTLLQGALAYLRALDPDDLDTIKEFLESGPPGGFEEPSLDPRATPTA
jgi:hypothetical protein